MAGPGWRIYDAGQGTDPAGAGLVVALLGPVEIGPAGGAMAPVAQPRLRVLLGLLGVAGGRVVTAEALVDGVWGEDWSPRREQNLHALVYQLRRRLAALEPGKKGARLVRAGAGYRLVLGPGERDVAVFGDLAGRGREAARAGDTGQIGHEHRTRRRSCAAGNRLRQSSFRGGPGTGNPAGAGGYWLQARPGVVLGSRRGDEWSCRRHA